MTLLKDLTEAKGIMEPLTKKELADLNKVHKLNGGKLVKVGKFVYQMLQVNESSSLKAVLDSESDNSLGLPADKLQVGAPVKIKGTSYDGQEGTIDSFGAEKKFVIVKLSSGKTSFHSSNVFELIETKDEEPDNEIKKFYVAFYDSTRETSWIGKVTRENGGMWHEKILKGKPSSAWGKEHGTFMTPDEILDVYNTRFPHTLKIEGPFFDGADAEEFVADNWGDIREGYKLKTISIDESVSKFHVETLKVLNATLRDINKDQQSESPFYSPEFAKDMKDIYRALYGALLTGSRSDFEKVWARKSGSHPDAFDEFAGMMFDKLKVKDYDSFAKALGINAPIKEALNADGYHVSLKNPKFAQNHMLMISGDPREYLHDESNWKPRDKSMSLVTFHKKSIADDFASRMDATVITTPINTYRLVRKKTKNKPVPVEPTAPVKEDYKGEKLYTDFKHWRDAVRSSYPEIAHKLKFVGRIETVKGEKIQTISAEIPNEDRSYGVWYAKQDEGHVLFEMFGPMGGDQRNMRGSRERKPTYDSSFKGFIEVNFPNWETESVKKRAEKFKVTLSPTDTKDKTLKVTGDKSGIIKFLTHSGWNSSDLMDWYPSLNEGTSDELIILDHEMLTEADAKVEALKVATDLLGTTDVKKSKISDDAIKQAHESSKKTLFAGNDQRWLVSLLQMASGKRLAKVVPPEKSNIKPFFIEPQQAA